MLSQPFLLLRRTAFCRIEDGLFKSVLNNPQMVDNYGTPCVKSWFQGSFLLEKSGSQFRFLPWAILLGLLVGIAGVWSSNKESWLFSMTMASMPLWQSLSTMERGIGSVVCLLLPIKRNIHFYIPIFFLGCGAFTQSFPITLALLKAANAAFLAGISILSGHAMQKSWNFAVVEAMDSILSANWASQDLRASTFRQRLFRNIGEPPPCMFVIAGSYPSMTPPRTSSSSREVCTTLKLFPTIFSRLSRKQREF
jgi:hypothetical protein